MPIIQIKNPKNLIQITGLQYARLQKHISIRALSKKIGRDESLIRAIEKKGTGSRTTILKICQILAISESEIKKIIEIEKSALENLERNILEKNRTHTKTIPITQKIDILFNKVLSSRWNSGLILDNYSEL